MYDSLVYVAPETPLMLALCACKVSLRSMGTACELMYADRPLSCGAVMITSVIRFPVTTSVACTVPNRFCTAVPVYDREVPAAEPAV